MSIHTRNGNSVSRIPVFTIIPASFSEYAVVDDFTHPLICEMQKYSCWAVTTASNPTVLELIVVDDASGPVGTPTSTNSYPCYTYDSGFTLGSYIVWVAEIILTDNPIYFFGGTTIWLGSHRNDGENWYPAYGVTVSGMNAHRTLSPGWVWEDISLSLEGGDLFKVVEGWAISSPLERTTWAGLKSAF